MSHPCLALSHTEGLSIDDITETRLLRPFSTFVDPKMGRSGVAEVEFDLVCEAHEHVGEFLIEPLVLHSI